MLTDNTNIFLVQDNIDEEGQSRVLVIILGLNQPFHSWEWSMSNFPCSLTRNTMSHSMENLTFHSLLRWKMIILQILATSLIHFLFERLRECTFWAQEWKGQDENLQQASQLVCRWLYSSLANWMVKPTMTPRYSGLPSMMRMFWILSKYSNWHVISIVTSTPISICHQHHYQHHHHHHQQHHRHRHHHHHHHHRHRHHRHHYHHHHYRRRHHRHHHRHHHCQDCYHHHSCHDYGHHHIGSWPVQSFKKCRHMYLPSFGNVYGHRGQRRG